MESLLREEMSLWWEVFVKHVGVKPGVKMRELWMRAGSESTVEEVTGATEIEKPVQRCRIYTIKQGVVSRDKVKNIERNDELILTRMI